ncbi:MAG: cytochrome c biogenesis protein ResB [Cytophagaceae bacterium]|jgi:hypothetical protein|nr:cytochrome c biogenesis protein ResB [Cytophagaceae bacterium]
MKQTNNHILWQTSWKYTESIIVTSTIIIAGFVLQITVGSINFSLLAAPVNLLLGGVIILLCIASLWYRNSSLMRWFTGVPMSVCLIAALLSLSLLMGLTPQLVNSAKDAVGLFARLGFNSMAVSWTFVLIYVTILLSLGCLIARKMCRFRVKEWAFYMNHAGLWLTLFAAGLGHVDMERYIILVYEGKTEWRVNSANGNMKELPIAIHLNDFDMEEYPPSLTVIDSASGMPLPDTSPDYYQIDTETPESILNGWSITLKQYIHQAIRNSDSTYSVASMPGAAPAAKIKAVHPENGTEVSGWISCGNRAQPYMMLPLNEQQTVVMTMPKPKRFMSDIEVYTPDGTVRKSILEVNKPLKVGSWTIYQYGYDNNAGRLSAYSSMELVYDPWAIAVYAGFILMTLGAVAMIWNGRLIKRVTKKGECK